METINVVLGEKQQQVFDLYINRQSVFMTGPGGTGKSTLIRKIYDHAHKNRRRVQVTALTGQAAQSLGCESTTLHRWAGIGICKGTIDEIVTKALRNDRTLRHWVYTDCLIVDEVSMMSSKMLEVLDVLGRKMTHKMAKKLHMDEEELLLRKGRGPELVFGGLQVIFSGDFFQLPPIDDGFAFEHPTIRWRDIFPTDKHIMLDILYRQSGDKSASFRKALNKIRQGQVSPSIITMLKSRLISPPADQVIPRLEPKKENVERINNQELDKLTGPSYSFARMKDSNLHVSNIMNDMRNEMKLGVKCDKDYERTMHVYKRQHEPELTEETLKYTEYLRKDLEEEYKDLENKVPIPEVLHLKVGAHVMCIVNSEKQDTPECRGYTLYNGCQGIVMQIEDGRFPIVKFNGIQEPIKMERYTWKSEKVPGISFSGFPLILSWAMTIHKSQGSTLDAAIMNLGPGVFSVGQTYVALSRVRSLEGVYLTEFDQLGIKASSKVRTFYKNLNTPEDPQTPSPVPPEQPQVIATCGLPSFPPNIPSNPTAEEIPDLEPSTQQCKSNDIRAFFKIPSSAST